MCLCSESQLGGSSADYRTVHIWPSSLREAHTFLKNTPTQAEINYSWDLDKPGQEGYTQQTLERNEQALLYCINQTIPTCIHEAFIFSLLYSDGLCYACFPPAVLKGTAGQPGSEGQAAGDGAAAQPKQGRAGATPTGSSGLLLQMFVCVTLWTEGCCVGADVWVSHIKDGVRT